MLDQVARLRRLAHSCETAEDRAWLSAALKRYLLAADDGLRLEDAFELSAPRHELPWWRRDAIERRDLWICQLARSFVRQPSLAARAEAVEQMLTRYAAGQWRIDRHLPGLPTEAHNTPRQLMFYALDADEVIPSARHIRRILAGR